MKKLLVISLACLSLMAAEANALVSIYLDARDLLEGGMGTPKVPQVTLVLLVVDTSEDGISTANLPTGIPLTLGASIGDDLIVARFDCSVGDLGYISATTEFSLGGSVVQGKPLGIIWLPGNTIGDSTLLATTLGKYGSYDGIPHLFGDDWLIPADGNLVHLVLDTSGDPDPEYFGYATHNVIPEPSTITLMGVGIFGLLGMMRRRRREEHGK